jgi:hypothetical protein
MQLAEETVKIDKYEIKIHELTAEEDAKAKMEAQIWSGEKKTFIQDQRLSDAWYLKLSVDPSTWPADFGALDVENIRKLPSRITKRLLLRIKKMNLSNEDMQDFLESQQSSTKS